MHRRRVIEVLGGGMAVALLAAWGTGIPPGAAAQEPPDDLRQRLAELGMQVPAQPAAAPEFALADLSGATVRLADHRGRALLLYFWATW